MRRKTKILVSLGVSVLLYCSMLICSIVYGGTGGYMQPDAFVEKGWPVACMRENKDFNIEILYGGALINYVLFLVIAVVVVMALDVVTRQHQGMQNSYEELPERKEYDEMHKL